MFKEHFFIFSLNCFIFVETTPIMSISQDLNIIMSCNSTSSVDKTTLNVALVENRFENEVNENFKCFLHCLYNKYKWMDKNGLFLQDEMRSALLESNLDETSIEYFLTTCTETEIKDKCERAYFFTDCFWTESEKLEQNYLSEHNEYF